jgi:carbonic anhydrase
LGTREIMLVHHTNCGMLTFTDAELAEAIEEEIGTRPAFSIQSFSNLEENVRKSIAQIQASPFIPHKEVIRGFVYEVETGSLREVK